MMKTSKGLHLGAGALLFGAALFGVSACEVGKNAASVTQQAVVSERPNIIIIYMDDLGIGDLETYNPASKIPTPHLNALADNARVFTDAHSASAVCTPSRYALLTGEYAWRTWLKIAVVGGYSPSVISADTPTLPEMLQNEGYQTAMVGKWHLGWGTDEGDLSKWMTGFTDAPVSFDSPPELRPTTLGFDWFYGISASLDMPPYAYIENGVYVEPPTEQIPARGKGSAYLDGGFYWRAGEIAENFDFDTVEPHLVEKVTDYIQSYGEGERDRPFFLYYASPAPHTPILPTAEFEGASEAGIYGDFVAQTDASVGRILAALEAQDLTEDTLIIFSSDNGGINYGILTPTGHKTNADFKGQKSDLYEGGHRVPFLVSWPGVIEPGTSDELVVMTDIFATIADILDAPLENQAAVDGFSFAHALSDDGDLGLKKRDHAVMHSLFGTFAIREGDWKLILDDQSGGYGATYPSLMEGRLPDPAPETYRLYNMAADPGETVDLAARRPDIVARLSQRLAVIRQEGRSRPVEP